MNWLDAVGVPPQLRGLPPWMLQSMQHQNDAAPDDSAWNAAHPHGYGTVEAPSPWGYNRDVFNAQHPGYAGGYYSPTTGRYDSPTEVPFTASGPHGPELIGTGHEPYGLGGYHSSAGGTMLAEPNWGLPTSPETSAAMGQLPTGGDSGAYLPQSNAGDLPSGGDTTPENFDMGAFLSALTDPYGQGNDPASNEQA